MADPRTGDPQIQVTQADQAPSGAEPAPPVEPNRAPAATDICATTAEGTPLAIDALAHATDPDGDSLRLLNATEPASRSTQVRTRKWVLAPSAAQNSS